MNRIYKSIRGWRADTEVSLVDNLVLSITTMKRNNGSITSHASVARRDGDFLSHMLYQDYSKTVAVASTNRATEKAIFQCHNSIDLESVKQDALAFYNI